jgi:hypothetical protein
MQTTQTQEGLTRTTAKMPADSRSIYFYNVLGEIQKLNAETDHGLVSDSAQAAPTIDTPAKQGSSNV